MRAYIRLDPRLPDHKEHYPDGPLSALALTFCYAEQQPDRGRFRAPILRALLGRRARWVAYLVEHGDLVEQEDGRLYLEGWDEWQEGDWQVAERMRRVRSRDRPLDRNGGYGPDRNAGDGLDRNGPVRASKTPSGVGGRRQAVGGTHNAQPGDTDWRESELSPDHPARQVLLGYHEVTGLAPTPGDERTAEDFVLNLGKRMSPAEMTERMRQHVEWCDGTSHRRPRTLKGFWNSLRIEADHHDESPSTRSSGGMSSVGDLLRGGQQQARRREEDTA